MNNSFFKLVESINEAICNEISNQIDNINKNAETAIILGFSAYGIATSLTHIGFTKILPGFLSGFITTLLISVLCIKLLIQLPKWRNVW